VNAAEQVNNFATASKIAAAVNLFKSYFRDARADLKPWTNDRQTRELLDPDSIDIGFHFPGHSRRWNSRSILVQIRFYEDPLDRHRRAIGVEAGGYDHRGQQWRFSTVDNWRFEGANCPDPEVGERLKQFCQETLSVFNNDAEVA